MLKWLHLGVAVLIIVMIISPLPQGTAWADGYPGSVDNGDGTRTLIFRPSGGLNQGNDGGGAGSGKDAYAFTNGDGVQNRTNRGSDNIHNTFNSNCNAFKAHSYFQWDVSALPPASDVTSVKLVFYHWILRSYSWPYQISPTAMNVKAVTSQWNEMLVTYDNQPAVAATVLASVDIPTQIWGPVAGTVRTAFEGFVTIDITGLYREWRSGARPNYGIQYSRPQSFCENANASYVYSSDYPDQSKRPALQITYKSADTTPPAITPVVAGELGSNGWYRSDVNVSWTVSDAESAVSATSGCAPSAVTADTGGEVSTCTATSAGGTSSQSVTVRRDGSPPLIAGSPSPLANGSGWNNTDVTVSFACDDALSGIASCSAPAVLAGEGAGQSVNGTATDKAGNSASAGVSGIKIDKTAPAIVAAATAAPNGNGWHKGNVTIHFTCTDDSSGIPAGACPPDQMLTTEGAAVASTAQTVTDAAGNVSAPSNIVAVNIDKTAPAAGASASPAPNASGWNNGDVTVSFSGTDGLSGIDSCSAVVVLNIEGAGQSASGNCTDKAGNISAPAAASGINIDKTAPSLAPSVNPNPVLLNGSATANANAKDSLSGIASSSCAVVNTSSVGLKTVTCTATDMAGNSATASASYPVFYNFSGFLQPIPAPVQTFKAGSTIPVKFQLRDAKGAIVSNASATLTANGKPATTQGGANTGNQFRYDPTGQLYIYNLSTKDMTLGGLTLVVSLDDGTMQKVILTLK